MSLSLLPKPRHFLVAPSLVLALSLALVGCANTGENFAPPCPTLTLLTDAGDLTRFAGAGRDVTDLALAARITAIGAKCARDGKSAVKATVNIVADVARGPSFTGRAVDIPYFIAITEAGRIVDKRSFTAHIDFPANVSRVPFFGPEIDLYVAVSPEKNASVYKIFVGFSLTADEVAYNRRAAGG